VLLFDLGPTGGIKVDLISLFVFRPNKIERPDGRPFYAYSITEDTLQRLEAELAQPKCTDGSRVKVLAFVAAERFRRTYKNHVWSWADCGRTVSRVREERGNLAFYKLIQESLKFWGLSPLKVHGRHQYLGSVVAYGGFPTAFLTGQSPLRGLLRHLLRKRMTGGHDELQRAACMSIPASGLPDAFKLSPFFTGLCVELVDVMADLAIQANGKVIRLESLNEEHPGWKRRLPLSFDGNDAEQLVAELLNVAAESASRDGTDLTFKRSIVRMGDTWTPRVRIADLPTRLALPEGCADTMYRLRVLVEGEVVQEVARLVRQRDQRYVAFPRLRQNDLQLDPSFAIPATTLAIQVTSERSNFDIPIDGGEPLDDELPWIFESVNKAATAENQISSCDLIAIGSIRTKMPFVVVAIREGWSVAEGAWTSLGRMQPGDGSSIRHVLRVQGTVVIDAGEAGDFTIRCAATEDGPTLKLTGSHARANSPSARQIFRGEARATSIPTAGNLEIQWRSVGEGHQRTWTTRLQMAKGLVRYRLCDGDVSVAETRALLLPDAFAVQSSHAAVTVTLGPGWRIDAPSDLVQHGEAWRVAIPATHKSAEMELLLASPYCVRPVVLHVPVFTVGEGFRRLLDGVAAPRKLTISEISEYVAYANGANASLWLTLNSKASFPYRLRAREGMSGSRLPLSLIQGDVRDLRYSSEEIDVPLTLSIGQKSLVITPQRILRAGDAIRLQEDRELRCPLRLRHLSLEHECILEPSDENTRTWSLPVDFPPGWAIVSVAEVGIRPLAVHLGEKAVCAEAPAVDFQHLIQLEGTSPERVGRLSQHLRQALDHAVSETSAAELEYLRLWLMRFDDVPTEFLDMFKAIANSPGDAIRLMAYSHGDAVFDALSTKLGRVPIYWHLVSKHSWDGFVTWWNMLLGSDEADLTEQVIQDLAFAQLETMALDADLVGMYQAFLIQRSKGRVERSSAYLALFNQRVVEAKLVWRNKVAALVEDFHGAVFPFLDAVSAAADQLKELHLLNTDFQAAYDWIEPVLVAPLVAAWASHDGMSPSDDLRRQVAYVRHLGAMEFDNLYAYSAMLLEQME